jgi:hypothetical protein
LEIYFHHNLFLICRKEHEVMTYHNVLHFQNIRGIVTCWVEHTKLVPSYKYFVHIRFLFIDIIAFLLVVLKKSCPIK